MERGTRVYQSLTRCAVEGGGLEQMAQTMRDLTGKSIVVQDKRLKPLAQSVAASLGQMWGELLPGLGESSQLPEDMRDRRRAAVGGWRDQLLPAG